MLRNSYFLIEKYAFKAPIVELNESIFVLLLLFCCNACNSNQKEASMNETEIKAPMALKRPHKMEKFGDVRLDNYYWLNARENPEVIDYLHAENAYTKQQLEHTEKLQKELYDEIVARFKENDYNVPFLRNEYYYQSAFEDGLEYARYFRAKQKNMRDKELILDQNLLAEGLSFHSLGGLNVSPDNKLLAFGEDTVGRRKYDIRIKNIEDGSYLDDRIRECTGSIVWANDSKSFYYTKKDETLRPYQIWRHDLGQDTQQDVKVYEEEDETYTCHIFKSKSNKFIIIGSFSTLATEMRYISADDSTGAFKVFNPRKKDLEYSIEHFDDQWFVLNNKDAKNFKISTCSLGQTQDRLWKDYIPHRPDVLIEDMDVFKDFMLITERIKGITNLRIYPWDGQDHYIDFGETSYVAFDGPNYELDMTQIQVGYSSLTTPETEYEYDVNTKELTVLKQEEILGGFESSNYKSQRIYAKASDGTMVPISVLYHKNTKLDGTAPTLLYGYGSYGASMDPYFSPVRLSLVDRGFVYAIAHIRGGSEMGRAWYEDGKLLKKKNTFTDFISCAEHLIDQGFSSPENMFAMGGSAGGLLMGAITNMRPELWKGIVSAVPFVDVLTTMLDESIPLTTGEYDEWGNPNEEVYYNYIKSYSPYDQLEAKAYPNLMVTTGLHDSQVQYWEPAKYVAKLREIKTDSNLLLMHTNMEAGHSGATGRFSRYKETAMEYAFLLDLSKQ